MLRTHTCGELRLSHLNQIVTLTGWANKVRDKGSVMWIDLRDRYGLTQLIFDEAVTDKQLIAEARKIGREFVIMAKGEVIERVSKNPNMPTGEIEVRVTELTVLNAAKLPPFLIEDETDGGEELRMKYRYLDLRRNMVRRNFELRHRAAQATRSYLDSQNFLEVETPVLIKSTPEGARDFVVPSRINPHTFYALPQSPQTFKQLLMVSGFDRYFQIVKCFRDEDLRADRQPEFTQIDCEMSFITQEDILNTFEGLIRHIFKSTIGTELPKFKHMTYAEAMENYGIDKPDLRFDMRIYNLNPLVKGKEFKLFNDAERVGMIIAPKSANYTRKELDALTEWVKRPQIGATGLVYVKWNDDGTFASSVSKFFTDADFEQWFELGGGQKGDLMLVIADKTAKALNILGRLRLEMGARLNLRDPFNFVPLWVLDFPLLEWDEDSQRFFAMHHPFTSPKPEDIALLDTDPGKVRANAYDMVINGVEVGGGSIRIHERKLQEKMFEALGIGSDEQKLKFGFLLEAFEFGAPPHGGIAFGFDRLVSMLGGSETIRDFIAFPKNTSGTDVMIEAPSIIDQVQLDELGLAFKPVVKK